MAATGQGREAAALIAPGLLCLLVVFFLPVGILVVQSFTVADATGTEFTIAPYRRFFLDPYYHGVVARTFRIAGLATLATMILGFPIAFIMARNPGPIALWLGIVVIMPLMVSVVVRTFGWMVLMGRGGVLSDLAEAMGLDGDRFVLMRTEAGIIVALAQVLLPFMTLTLYGVMARIGDDLGEAARTLGAGFFTTMWRITLPLSLPGLVSGALIVFALSISFFITPTLIGGPRLPVLAASIYQQAVTTIDWPFAAAQAVILLVAVLIIVTPAMALTRVER